MFGLSKKNKNITNLSSSKRSAPEVDLGGKSSVPTGSGTQVTTDVSGFNKAIQFILVALVFLVPIFFLSTTSELREFNKQSLLFLAVVLMLGIWVIKILTTRQVSWVKTSLDYVILGLLGVQLLSTLFSIDRTSSFLGYYGRFTGSLMSVIALVVLYFLIVNNVRTERLANQLIKWLSISFGIVLIYSFLQLVGLYILPFSFAQSNAFNTIGSLVALSLFAALSLLLTQWQWMNDKEPTKVRQGVYSVMTIIGLLVMFLVNAFVGWLILGLGMIAFLALGMVLSDQKQQGTPNWFWRPMLILVLSILFVAFQFLPQSINPRNLVTTDLPIEIQLSNSTTIDMVTNSLSGGAKTAILGSGPGTTGIAFGSIKPRELNKTIVWRLNFDRASTEITGLTIETGILGLLAFEITAILFLFYALYFLLKKPDHPGRMQAFLMFIMWLALYITHFFYYFPTTFYFLYWFSLAMFIAVTHWKEQEGETKTLSFSSSPRSALSWMFVSLLLLAGLLVGAFFQTAVYVAETAYVSGLRALNKPNPDFLDVESKLRRAVSLNPYRDVYYLALGQNLIFRASEEAAKAEPNVQNIQTLLAGSVNAGVQATRVSPAKASNWTAVAQFYTGIRPLGVAGADDAIINAWQEAIKRDPNNPSLYIQLAQAYSTSAEIIDPSIAGSGPDTDQDGLSDDKEAELGSNPENRDSNGNGVSDGDEVQAGFNPAGAGRLTPDQLASFTRIDQAALDKAKEALNTAISLKDDLPGSYIALARIFEKSKNIDAALAKLVEAVGIFPRNSDVIFEQGRITFNQGNLVEAQRIFESVIRLVPNHANAHYSLGLVHQRNGDNVLALEEFETARAISGPNVDLERLINSLKETEEVPEEIIPEEAPLTPAPTGGQ